MLNSTRELPVATKQALRPPSGKVTTGRRSSFVGTSYMDLPFDPISCSFEGVRHPRDVFELSVSEDGILDEDSVGVYDFPL